MRSKNNSRPHVILMIDDNPTDVLLMKEAFSFCEGKNYEIHVAEDGLYAMDFLKRQGQYHAAPRPDIILLDLNMPRKNGLEVLMAVKTDSEFMHGYTLGLLHGEGHEVLYANHNVYKNEGSPAEVTEIQTFYEKQYLEINKAITYIRFKIK